MPRILITEPNKVPQPYRFPIDCPSISIGTNGSNDVVIESPSVSGYHCVIERITGGYIIRDNNSTNGMKQGDVRLAVGDLFNESEITIGDTIMKFELSEGEVDTISEEDFVSHLAYPSKKKINPQVDPAADFSAVALPETQTSDLTQSTLPTAPFTSTTPTAPFTHSPAQNPRSTTTSGPTIINSTSSTSMSTFIMLGALAFVIGLCIRHQMDTGNFLLTELLMKVIG